MSQKNAFLYTQIIVWAKLFLQTIQLSKWSMIKMILPADMRFVQNFTPPDFRAKTFTPSISPNFKGFIDEKQTMNLNGQISTLPSGYHFKFQLVPKYISKVKLGRQAISQKYVWNNKITSPFPIKHGDSSIMCKGAQNNNEVWMSPPFGFWAP